MLKKVTELKRSRSLEENLLTQSTIKSNFHDDTLLKARFETCHDLITHDQITRRKFDLIANTDFENKLSLSAKNIKKGQEIEQVIKESQQLILQKSINLASITFGRALRHYCFYDIINEDKDKITIIFLPITTSDKKILCGIQKFDKVLMYSNEVNNFYITRLLFQKTMNRSDYDQWVTSTNKYEGNINVRKIIFNKIQKDLDINQYSVIKDTDILDSTSDTFTKELPLIKFKFTDLEF